MKGTEQKEQRGRNSVEGSSAESKSNRHIPVESARDGLGNGGLANAWRTDKGQDFALEYKQVAK